MPRPTWPPARRLLNQFGVLILLALTPALIVFGWRAVLLVAGVVVSRAIAATLIRRAPTASPRGIPLLPVDALLVCTLLPAETASSSWWPLLPTAGVVLVLLQRLRSALPIIPFDAAVVTLLLLHGVMLIGGNDFRPAAALQRRTAVTGDVLQATDVPAYVQPWYERAPSTGDAAEAVPWSVDALDDYLHGRLTPDRASESLDGLIRDRLPPLEDLVLMGHPMPLGQASGVFLIGLVLWGSYRRTIDWRGPILAGLAAYASLILLAVPTSMSINGGNWRFFAAARADVGPATALTFAHYIAFSSPIIITLGLFASRFETRAMRSGAVVVWAIALGVLTAACTLYVSVALGPILVIAFAPALGRLADRWIRRGPMRLPG